MGKNSKPNHTALPPDKLRWRCDPKRIPFETTADIEPVSGDMGQDRALRALRMGVEMTASGYNLFVCGLSGTSRGGMIVRMIDALTAKGVRRATGATWGPGRKDNPEVRAQGMLATAGEHDPAFVPQALRYSRELLVCARADIATPGLCELTCGINQVRGRDRALAADADRDRFVPRELSRGLEVERAGE